MDRCPECDGQTILDNGEVTCSACGLVLGPELATRELEDHPTLVRRREGRRVSGDTVDRTWRYIIRDRPARDNPIPALSSLFINPFVGMRVYRKRKRRTRAMKYGFDESYIDMRRREKTAFHGHILRLVERARNRFSYTASGRKQKGLFAACLYVESMLDCFEQLKFQAEVLGALRTSENSENGRIQYLFTVSKRRRKNMRAGLVMPKPLEEWASIFHVSEKSIMTRIGEIEEEKPSIGRIVTFVRHF